MNSLLKMSLNRTSALSFGKLSLLVMVFVTFLSAQLSAEGETRVVAGIANADTLIEELEYMVSELAGRKDSFENNVFPNIDIFLIGVDTEKPIRFDPLFSEQHGMELQLLIPLIDLDDFLNDNLDPIGIIPKPDRRDRDLYELTGNVYEGWLRVLKDPDYAVIFPRKEVIPKGMEHPAKMHEKLVEKGFSLFAELDNTKTESEARQSAFEKMAKNTLDGIQKRPSESNNEHALRIAVLDQQLSMFQQYFVESRGLSIGSHIDQSKAVAIFDLTFNALDGTQLSKDIERVTAEPSYFAAVEPVKDSVLTTRIHFMLNEAATTKLKKVYGLTETVAKEESAANDGLTADEKTSRSKLSELMNTILTQSAELKVIDCFVDVVPSGSSHAFVMGVRSKGQAEINSAIDEIVAGREGLKLTKEIANIEGTVLHKLELGEDAPAALKELYGDGFDTVILGVSDEAFWIAFGEKAEEELGVRIQAVQAAVDVKGDGVIFSFDAKVAPLVKSLNELLNDENSLIGELYQERQAKRSEQKKLKEEENEESEDERPAREAAQNFLSFEWVENIIGTMKGEDDTLKFEMKVNEAGAIQGNGFAHKGILKAIGVMIADFADENLQ